MFERRELPFGYRVPAGEADAALLLAHGEKLDADVEEEGQLQEVVVHQRDTSGAVVATSNN